MKLQPSPNRVVGVAAFLLAIGIAIGSATAFQSYAFELAKTYAKSYADGAFPIKFQSLTFQRAALARDDLLLIYGGSELFCNCADPYRGTRIFRTEPTGFQLFTVGEGGINDATNFQAVAALGNDFRGKKLVLSETPGNYYSPTGMGATAYAHHFSPELAAMFAFDAPISLQLRRAGARRMLAYPETLHGYPVLRSALQALAGGAGGLPLYDAMIPAGRVTSWTQQVQDAFNTVQFIRSHPEIKPDLSKRLAPLDWTDMIHQATTRAEQLGAGNPFGMQPFAVETLQNKSFYQDMVNRYCRGKTNRDGQLDKYPDAWVNGMEGSESWTDLSLTLGILAEVGGQPLVVSTPIEGIFFDYSDESAPARAVYYQQLRKQTAETGAPVLAFQDHEEDRFFQADDSGHLSPRGWVFFARAIDLYWHGQSIPDLQHALDDLENVAPAQGVPPTAQYCGGTRG